MKLVCGIDPGVTGAVALYDVDADKLVAIFDLPSYPVIVSKTKKRNHIDTKKLDEMFATYGLMGLAGACLEKVSGWGKQSGVAMFTFGYTYAKVESAVERICPVYPASPDVWKLQEKIPLTAKAIVALADREFPEFKHMFHGPKGGAYHDRAEAAFLSRYYARRVWPTLHPRASLRAAIEAMPGDVKAGKLSPKLLERPATSAKPRKRAKP